MAATTIYEGDSSMEKKPNPMIVNKFREALAEKGHSVKSERGFALAIQSITTEEVKG